LRLDNIWSLNERYSARKLTLPEDYLNAFLGILRAFEEAPDPIDHYWGIPLLEKETGEQKTGLVSTTFLENLNWALPDKAERRAGFSSWSWLGWIGKIYRPKQDSFYYSPCTSPEDLVWVEVGKGRWQTLHDYMAAAALHGPSPKLAPRIQVRAGVTAFRLNLLRINEKRWKPMDSRLRLTRNILVRILWRKPSSWTRKKVEACGLGVLTWRGVQLWLRWRNRTAFFSKSHLMAGPPDLCRDLWRPAG